MDRLLPIIEGREPHEPLLERWRRRQIGPVEWVKDSRGPWNSASEMTRTWQAVLKQVGMPPSVVPYALRHSSVVRAIAHDLPIRLVAALHDTSVAMIERFYSRWFTDKLDDLASEAALTLK